VLSEGAAASATLAQGLPQVAAAEPAASPGRLGTRAARSTTAGSAAPQAFYAVYDSQPEEGAGAGRRKALTPWPESATRALLLGAHTAVLDTG